MILFVVAVEAVAALVGLESLDAGGGCAVRAAVAAAAAAVVVVAVAAVAAAAAAAAAVSGRNETGAMSFASQGSGKNSLVQGLWKREFYESLVRGSERQNARDLNQTGWQWKCQR